MIKLPQIPRSLSLILLILFVIGLYISLNELVIPLAVKVATSDLLPTEPNPAEAEFGSDEGLDVKMMATAHCNTFVQKELDSDNPPEFPGKNVRTWEVGPSRYLVRALFYGQSPGGLQVSKSYTCDIHYDGGGLGDEDNWSLMGLVIN